MLKRTNLHELHLFSGGGDLREVVLCLSRGNDRNMPDDDGWTPLHWACYRRQPEMTQLLLEREADPLLVTFSGDTSLHAAATENSIPCLKLVLDCAEKRNLNIIDLQNNLGYNALMFTAAKGHVNCAKLLLDRGADIQAKNKLEGDSALHIAACNNQVGVLDLLLSRGADIDAANRTGDTALHGAAMEGNVKAATILLKLGAQSEVKNHAGQTPVDLARFWNETDVLKAFAKKKTSSKKKL